MLNTRRKVIKQGHNTLTMTLPSKWVNNFKIKPGDEINLVERDNGLFLSTEKQEEKRSITIDISGLFIPNIWSYYMSAYREGYDEIKFTYNPDELFAHPYKFFTKHTIDVKYGKDPEKYTAQEVIDQVTNRFIGFEVVEHHRNYSIVRDMGNISSKEFDTSLRRVFLLLQQMGQVVVDATKTDNLKILPHIHDIDINLDKFHDYCIRVLNKTGFTDVRRGHLIFCILYLLELTGDELKKIAYHFIEEMEGKSLKNLIQISELTVEQIKSFYEIYYKFSKEKLIELSQRDMDIYLFLPKLYKQNPKAKELSIPEKSIMGHWRRVSQFTNALIELRTEMEF